jgi:YD repeat-containing protein
MVMTRVAAEPQSPTRNGHVTSYAYDDADRLILVTDAASNVTSVMLPYGKAA